MGKKITKICLLVSVLLFFIVGGVLPASANTKITITTSKKTNSSNSGANNIVRSNNNLKIVAQHKLAHQTYNKSLTGMRWIFDRPSGLANAKLISNGADVNKLINQGARFMTYQVARTNDGTFYYKVVSQHHSVWGWIRADGIKAAPIVTNAFIKVKITNIKMINDHNYNHVLNGKARVFNKPSALNGAKIISNQVDVNQLAKQGARFRVQRIAKTNDGNTYYQIDSLHHTLKGWVVSGGLVPSNY